MSWPPSAHRVAIWLAEEVSSPQFVELSSVIVATVSEHIPNRSIEEVSEFTEGSIDAIENSLRLILADAQSDGIEPTYELSDEDGALYIKSLPRPETSLVDVLRSLTSDNFERLCADILQGIGANSSRVGNRDDGGIDFVGLNLSPGPETCVISGSSRLLVLGQAKRYTRGRFVSESEVRKFVGGAVKQADDLRRTRSDIGPLTPVLYAFWTTSDFHADAKVYMREMGIWSLNGIGLAQFIHRLDLLQSNPV